MHKPTVVLTLLLLLEVGLTESLMEFERVSVPHRTFMEYRQYMLNQSYSRILLQDLPTHIWRDKRIENPVILILLHYSLDGRVHYQTQKHQEETV